VAGLRKSRAGNFRILGGEQMSKSNFNALVEAKKRRDVVESAETGQIDVAAENKSPEKDALLKSEPKPVEPEDTDNQIADPRPNKRNMVRRSYRVDEPHDKAIKVMSKFMGQGTEEEIVLNIFVYFFENNTDGKKAMQMVGMLESN
jgi:hypothetical protein